MKTRRLTMAQAIVQFLKAQYVARDGVEYPFFARRRVYETMREKQRDYL